MAILDVPIDSRMIARAEKRNNKFWQLFQNTGTLLVSKTKDIRQFGYLGEEIVYKVFPQLQYTNTPSHDFHFNSLRFEAKSKSCTTFPRGNYVASVMAYQKDRELDYFIFVRIHRNLSRGWILGWISKERFFDEADFMKKGTKNCNFRYDNDRYCIEISKLNDPRMLRKILTMDLNI